METMNDFPASRAERYGLRGLPIRTSIEKQSRAYILILEDRRWGWVGRLYRDQRSVTLSLTEHVHKLGIGLQRDLHKSPGRPPTEKLDEDGDGEEHGNSEHKPLTIDSEPEAAINPSLIIHDAH